MSVSNPHSSRRVVIVGIPGVGKSTVVTEVVEMLKSREKEPRVVNYGTVMMEQAVKFHNVKSRDEMRKLPIEDQRALQIHAASEISRIKDETVIVDTHLFISTTEGFWPGIPMYVLQALNPTNLILVIAKPEEILARRKNDPTRSRDAASKQSLERELNVANSLLLASSVITGCPALIVENPEGRVEEAALRILGAIAST